MKPLEATITLRNNRLKQRRLALGMTQGEVARAAGIEHAVYNAMECLRYAPYGFRGRPKEAALKVAAFLDAAVDELWPEAVLAVQQTHASLKLDLDDVHALMAHGHLQRLVARPDDLIAQAEQTVALRAAMEATCTPRQRMILGLRYGLNGDEPMSCEQIAAMAGITGTRVAQILRDVERRIYYAMTVPSDDPARHSPWRPKE